MKGLHPVDCGCGLGLLSPRSLLLLSPDLLSFVFNLWPCTIDGLAILISSLLSPLLSGVLRRACKSIQRSGLLNCESDVSQARHMIK